MGKFVHGADHEANRRAGTENVLEIVGLGQAAEIAMRDMERNMAHMRAMRDRSWAGLTRELDTPGLLRLNGHPRGDAGAARVRDGHRALLRRQDDHRRGD
jgi:cysteine desulfurase